MAGTCRQCKGQTTNTRAKSAQSLCFRCEHGIAQDNRDYCLVCGTEIPPGPDFCSSECERKARGNGQWEVGHDGPSRPMLLNGMRMFTINEFINGKWTLPDDEEEICALIVRGLNKEE